MKLRALLIGTALLCIPGVVHAAEIKSVKVPSANFREGPSTTSTIMFSADKFYPVEIIKTTNGWARVKDFEGDEAWVAERLLGNQETVVIAKERVNVREKNGTASDVVFKAERGEVFKVLERKDRWLHVADSNNEEGWIRDDMTWGEHPQLENDGKDGSDKKADAKADKKADAKADKKADAKADKKADAKADKTDKAEEKAEKTPEKKACSCPDADEKSAEKKVAKPKNGEDKNAKKSDESDQSDDKDEGKKAG